MADARKNGYSCSKAVMLSEVGTVAVSLPQIPVTRTTQLGHECRDQPRAAFNARNNCCRAAC